MGEGQHALESESEKKRDSKKGIFLKGKDTHEKKKRGDRSRFLKIFGDRLEGKYRERD